MLYESGVYSYDGKKDYSERSQAQIASLDDLVPFGKNYTRRFQDTDLFQKIFSRILMEVDAWEGLDTESLFIDGTHIKASANPHKYQNETIKKKRAVTKRSCRRK